MQVAVVILPLMDKAEMLQLRLAGLTYRAIAGRAGISNQRVQQLLSPPRAVRRAVVSRADGRCARCGVFVGSSGQVHHKSAEGLEPDTYNDLQNLELLCLVHHMNAHARKGVQMVTKSEEKVEEPRHCVECAKVFVTHVGSRRMYCDSCMAERVGGGRPPKAKEGV